MQKPSSDDTAKSASGNSASNNTAALVVSQVVTKFGQQVVHKNLNFTVKRGSIATLIGSSGSGKSTILREILGLLRPTSGAINLLGIDVWAASPEELQSLRRRYGVLFQNGALFSALTVAENIAAPLREQLKVEERVVQEVVQLRLAQTGLSADTYLKMPSQLSGGMRKRVALARALVLEPEFLFLDEPTSGLDPINARAFDKLIQTLSDSLGVSVLIVTHDLETIDGIADNVIALDKGVVVASGRVEDVKRSDNQWVNEYFSSKSNSSRELIVERNNTK